MLRQLQQRDLWYKNMNEPQGLPPNAAVNSGFYPVFFRIFIKK